MLDGDFLDHWHNCITMYVFHSIVSSQSQTTLKIMTNVFSSFFSAIAWLIIPMDVNIERGWFIFHSWNLFVAICAIPRCFLHALSIITVLRLFFHSFFSLIKSCHCSFEIFSSLMLACWLFFFPESPKFLIECGETVEALEILRQMYHENTGNKKSDYPVGICYILPTITRNSSEFPKKIAEIKFPLFL